jgi:hypothetical protein
MAVNKKAKPSFDQAFPDIEDILVRCGANPAPLSLGEHSETLSIRARWPYEGAIVRCTRTDCRLPGGIEDERGFFDLTSAIEEALAAPLQVSERLLSCNGKLAENSKAASRKTSAASSENCDNTLYCRIEVLRKPQTVAGGR